AGGGRPRGGAGREGGRGRGRWQVHEPGKQRRERLRRRRRRQRQRLGRGFRDTGSPTAGSATAAGRGQRQFADIAPTAQPERPGGGPAEHAGEPEPESGTESEPESEPIPEPESEPGPESEPERGPPDRTDSGTAGCRPRLDPLAVPGLATATACAGLSADERDVPVVMGERPSLFPCR